MNREKKQAKSREAAVRHARETAAARERWKTAKDVAKKHAAGLQSSLSRTFSRKKTLRSYESSKGGMPSTESTDGPSKTSQEERRKASLKWCVHLTRTPRRAKVSMCK